MSWRSILCTGRDGRFGIKVLLLWSTSISLQAYKTADKYYMEYHVGESIRLMAGLRQISLGRPIGLARNILFRWLWRQKHSASHVAFAFFSSFWWRGWPVSLRLFNQFSSSFLFHLAMNVRWIFQRWNQLQQRWWKSFELHKWANPTRAKVLLMVIAICLFILKTPTRGAWYIGCVRIIYGRNIAQTKMGGGEQCEMAILFCQDVQQKRCLSKKCVLNWNSLCNQTFI